MSDDPKNPDLSAPTDSGSVPGAQPRSDQRQDREAAQGRQNRGETHHGPDQGAQDAPGGQDQHQDQGDIDDPGVQDMSDAELLAECGDPDRDMIIDPAPYEASDKAQGFHNDGDVVLTIVEILSRPLTKSYGEAPDGTIVKGERPKTGHGRFVRATLSGKKPMARLRMILRRLKSNQAVMTGTWHGHAPMRRMLLQARYDNLPVHLRDPAGPGPLWRGKCFVYLPGKPALLLLDIDPKEWPDWLRNKVKQAGDLRGVLDRFDAQWRDIGFLARPSVSNDIRHKVTGVRLADGGWHFYVIAEDGADIERYVRALFQWLVRNGFGYGFVTKAGSLLLRALIDPSASGVPYWLAFESNAVLTSDRLEHDLDARQCKVREGPRLDTRRVSDPTADEQREFDRIKAELRAEKQPKMDAIRLERGEAKIKRLVAGGMPKDKAERLILDSAEAGRLSLDATYYFDRDIPGFHRHASGWDILANPDLFHLQTGADPEEPDYGGGVNKARWHLRRRGGFLITSFAHGGQRFTLAYDAEDIITLVETFSGTVPEQLSALERAYRQYSPVDCDRARRLLREAGIPSPVMLDFVDRDDLSSDGLLAAIRAAFKTTKWGDLASLRATCGRFFEQALGELRDQDDLRSIDFDHVITMMDAAAENARKGVHDTPDIGPLDHRPEVDALMRDLNGRFFVLNDGKAIIVEQDKDENGNPAYRYHSFRSFTNLFLNRLVEIGDDRKGKPVLRSAGEVWIKHPRRRQYMGGEVFDPRNDHRPDQFNRWRGWGVQPVKGDWSLMREHIRAVVCGGDQTIYDYVIRWLARMLQYPWLVGEVILVLRGDEGAGKGILGWWLMRVAGSHGYYISDTEHLTGRFNDHLFGKVFMFADEAFFAGDKASAGKLKALATEPEQAYEAKGRPLFRGRNAAHVLMTTNNRWVVPASLDSRRWCVLDVSGARLNDRAYFNAIGAELDRGGAEAMLYDLLLVDLGGFEVRDYPVTAALIEQRDISLDHEIAWLKDVLHRGHVWESRCGRQDYFGQWHSKVTMEVLYRSYESFARQRHERRVLSRGAFGRFLVRMGARTARLKDAVVGARGGGYSGELMKAPRPPGYALGALSTARADFTKRTGQPI
jgi:hypothetical protein